METGSDISVWDVVDVTLKLSLRPLAQRGGLRDWSLTVRQGLDAHMLNDDHQHAVRGLETVSPVEETFSW
jgi:hypothetical protein